MVTKQQIQTNSCVKGRDKKRGNIQCEISLKSFQSDILNLVIEFIEPSKNEWLLNANIAPPPNSKIKILKFDDIWVIVTIIGNEDELLVCPLDDGFQVSHYNSRYSANRKDVQYQFEAYG